LKACKRESLEKAALAMKGTTPIKRFSDRVSIKPAGNFSIK